MGKIRIITDSASDLSKENQEKYDILVLSYTIILDGKYYKARIDFDNK